MLKKQNKKLMENYNNLTDNSNYHTFFSDFFIY